MLPLGHLAGGYLATKTVLSFFKNLSQKQKKSFLIFGILIALLPDLDFIYPLLKFGTIFTKRSVFNHHATIFHSLFFWLIISLIIFAFSVIARRPALFPKSAGRRGNPVEKQKLFRMIALIFFTVILSHLILDSFFIRCGPLWLWPFSSKTYGFIFQSSDISGFAGFLLYFSHPVFYLEILLSLIVFYFLIKKTKNISNSYD
jgi:membrane-bound metal-dependent hydrolase YbcI (DUF457 family)